MDHVGTSKSDVKDDVTIFELECSCGWKATPSSEPSEMTAQQEAHLAEVLSDNE